MTRVIKAEEYAAKRNEILDSAQRLIYSKGYEQMSIRDILDDLGISKGAFYHYFDSKMALLDALVDRMLDEVECVLNPIVEDESLSAVEKLQRYFATATRWKADRKTFVLALLRVWYADENAIFRQKQTAATLKRIAPALAAILRQGVTEGVLTTAYPDLAGEIILGLLASLGDTFAQVLLADEPPVDVQERIQRAIAAYTETLERMLGMSAGSLVLLDAGMLDPWMHQEVGDSINSANRL
jgi:AcrR family transcriptional regulator